MKNTFFRFRFTILFSFIGFVVLLLVAISCSKSPYIYSYSEGLKPVPGGPRLPATAYTYPNTNGSSNDLITLGRVLFYDKNLSQDNSVACGSCHQQAYGFADNKSFSTGFGSQHTTRNAHSLVNTNDSKFWDGKVSGSNSGSSDGGYGGTQSMPILTVPFQSHVELNIQDNNTLCTKLSSLSYYPYLFNNAFQSPTVSIDQIQLAIGSFIATITASNSTYDQAYPANGSPGLVTLSPQQQAGMAIFNGRGKCASCHVATSSFSGTDGQFEDIGLNLVYNNNDLGRGAITGDPSDNGKFHVPSLKNVALSAPYMHDGRFKTLTQVVDFFSDSIQSSPNLSGVFASSNGTAVPLGLTATEKSNLVAFLQTLTDNSLVTDIRYSNPFAH